MTRLPTLSAQQALSALQRGGFEVTHQRGSHVRLVHRVQNIKTVIPVHPGDMSRPLLKKIIKQCGLSEEQFRQLL
jgi:predicted RNA binding protein YcfA (HicA-like mRNA interferase family)